MKSKERKTINNSSEKKVIRIVYNLKLSEIVGDGIKKNNLNSTGYNKKPTHNMG